MPSSSHNSHNSRHITNLETKRVHLRYLLANPGLSEAERQQYHSQLAETDAELEMLYNEFGGADD